MKTKNLLMLAIVLSLFLTVNINTASALPLWQFGLEDQSWSEFQVVPDGSFGTEHNINFGIVSADNPGFHSGAGAAGYLYTHNPFPQYSHVTTAAGQTLSFEFTLEDDYRQLDLSYGRFGSEIDYLYFDGIEIFSADGTAENAWDLFEYEIIGDIYAGDHTLTIAYGGGDSANGHFIDFLRMENGLLMANAVQNNLSASIPEPGTFFLVGTGMLTLVGGCRRKIKSSA